MKISYSTHGLPGNLFDLMDAFDRAGYMGVELAFQEGQFDPRNMNFNKIATYPIILKLKEYFKAKKIKPACINTATLPLIPGRLHEPTVISLDESGRQFRIEIIKKGIEIAKCIGAPIVGFGSGFIREEHVNNPSIDPMELLMDSISECLKFIGNSPVTLAIEPEPGMFIETIKDGIDIIKKVNSDKFKLHLDLCHAYCSDHNYIEEIDKACPYTCYLHLSDASEGYNLKIINYYENMKLDLNFASYLIYLQEEKDFLLVDQQQSIYFYRNPPSQDKQHKIELTVKKINKIINIKYIDYNYIINLPRPSDYIEKEKEIKTFLLSMPAISYNTLDLASPIIHYLRRNNENPIISKMVANTLTGNVHYHEVPGDGKIDFNNFFKVLKKNNFTGYGALELYHHGDTWKKALLDSKKYLDQFC